MNINEDIKKFRNIVINEKIDDERGVAELANIAQELEEIRDEMIDAMERAQHCLRRLERIPEFRREALSAKSYWFPHIRMAINNEHDYLGSNETIQDTIDAIRGEVGEE